MLTSKALKPSVQSVRTAARRHHELNMWPIWFIFTDCLLTRSSWRHYRCWKLEPKVEKPHSGSASGGSQNIDRGVQDRRNLSARPWRRRPVPTLKVWETLPPPTVCWGLHSSLRVRLNWRVNLYCTVCITLSPSGETTLTLPLPSFTIYFLPSSQERKTTHIKRSL